VFCHPNHIGMGGGPCQPIARCCMGYTL